MTKLKIGHNEEGRQFKLPLDLITQTLAILAKRGKGKTYTSSVIAEELLDGGQQIIVIDPTGAWYGLRSSANGKEPGFPVVVFGGDHADVPLEEGSGEILATAIVEKNFSAIFDVSNFRKGQARRFLVDFLETLYRLNREPVHLFVDEADDVCPQKPMGDEARLVGALEDIVKRGRKKGIGASLITQRPASLNKDVLTQCEVLVTMGLSHPRDIDAIEEWINVHADPKLAERMIKSLPALPIGTAWFWSPGWGDFFERVKVRARRTFDSSATPKPGARVTAPKVLAKVDLEKLGKQITDTIERKRAQDPAAMKAKIQELSRKIIELESRSEPKVIVKPEPQLFIPPGVLKAVEQMNIAAGRMSVLANNIEQEVREAARKTKNKEEPTGRHSSSNGVKPRISDVAETSPMHNDSPIGGPEKRLLTALAQYPSGCSKRRMAILSGYALGGGSFNRALSLCRTKGFVEGRENLKITRSGEIALGPWQPLPTGDNLLRYWLDRLGKPERVMLEAVAKEYPRSVTKGDLGSVTGYQVGGGSFNRALSRLRTLQLVDGRSEIIASQDLF